MTVSAVNITDHSRLSHGDIKDRNGTPLKVGDLILSGMRRDSPNGWTIERVGEHNGSPILVDPKTGETMAWSWDAQLRIKLTPEVESRWRLGESLIRRCPHDKKLCPHRCALGEPCHRDERDLECAALDE